MSQVKTLTDLRHGNFMEKLPPEFLFPYDEERVDEWNDPNHVCYSDDYFGYGQERRNWFSYLATNDQHRVNHHYRYGKPRDENACGAFAYIRYDPDSFKSRMFKAMKGARSFVDVGCGGGDKLAIIKENWPHVHVTGIEQNPTLAHWARLYADEVLCVDALTQDYSKWDVIYMYWPIQDPKLMNELCFRVAKTMRKRAKVVLVGFRAPQDLQSKIPDER